MPSIDFNNLIPELQYYVHRKCTPAWEIKQSITTFVDITYILHGQARYTIGDREYMVKKGDLLCIPKNSFRVGTNVPDDLMECYTINFTLCDRSGQEAALPIPIISHIGNVPRLIASFHEIHDVWFRRDFGYMIEVTGILCRILHQILNLLLNENYPKEDDPRIKKSIQYINANFQNPISIDVMAKLCHLSPVYYGNLFHKAMGMTFRQYLASLRLNYAENMLKCGEYSVKEAAQQSGFADVFYFSKLFKEKKGVSPSHLISSKNKWETSI